MHPDRRVDQLRVPASQRHRSAGRGQVVARDQDPLDPRRDGAGDDGLSIGVEGGILEVAV
jgi:hypothetical protein